MDQFLQAETLVIELLLIISLVAIAVQRLRIPYTVALVVVGLLITFQTPLTLEITPELILALFVPPLVFEAAFHINLTELRRSLPGILALAIRAWFSARSSSEGWSAGSRRSRCRSRSSSAR